MNDLRAQVHDALDAVGPDDWRRLFGAHPDPLELIALTQTSGMDGFTFRSLVVRDSAGPVLLLPLFEVAFALQELVEGAAKKIVGGLARMLPGLLRPRLLGVGFVEGEWGAVGVRPGADDATLRQAWALAARALFRLARQRGASLVVFLNFTPATAAALPADLRRRLAALELFPCGRLAVDFASLDNYLAALSKNARKDLRRKLRDAREVKIVRATDPGRWLDRIYELYRATVARADLALGAHRPEYFRAVCRQVPGAHYVLYLREGRLLAFNLLIRRGEALVDKYFCADEEAGRAYSLYFVSWVENVRHCIEERIAVYHAGPGAEGTKARLGARFVPSLTLFRHLNPAVHWLLSKLRPLLAYTPQVDLSGARRLEMPAYLPEAAEAAEPKAVATSGAAPSPSLAPVARREGRVA